MSGFVAPCQRLLSTDTIAYQFLEGRGDSQFGVRVRVRAMRPQEEFTLHCIRVGISVPLSTVHANT